MGRSIRKVQALQDTIRPLIHIDVTLSRLWSFLAVALPVMGGLIASLPSVDLAYHLRAGAEILDTRAIPSSDAWTFTAAGMPWTDQQWGAQAVLGTVYRLGGWTGLVVLRAVLVAIIVGCLFVIGRDRGLSTRWAALLALAAFVVSAAALGLRPQLLGMALFAVVLVLVAGRRAHPGRLWAIPVIVLVWANIHGSFFLGPVVLGLAWLEDIHDRWERPHRALIVGLVAAAAACVTPFGPAVWAYAVGLSANSEVTRRITEWQPTSLRDGVGILFFASAFAVVALLARRGKPVPWPTLAWLAVFFVIGAYAARGIAWWPLGAVPAVAGLLGGEAGSAVERPERGGTPLMRRLNAVVAGAIVVAGVAPLPVWRPTDPGLQAPSGVIANAPSGITAALRELVQPGDRLLNPQIWGSWFEFAVPDLPVAIDSRIELFQVDVWNRYDLVMAGRDGWEAQLDEWRVTVAVVAAGDPGLKQRLASLGWQTAYEDEDGSIETAPDRAP
jgi:hypothetical protein